MYTHASAGAIPPAGLKVGFDGRELPPGPMLTWQADSIQEVAWSMFANHGGGYAYRLCKANTSEGLTESCFQHTHLQFVGDEQWIQFGTDRANRTAIPALRTAKGTFPEGSDWTRNPIPACSLGNGHPS